MIQQFLANEIQFESPGGRKTKEVRKIGTPSGIYNSGSNSYEIYFDKPQRKVFHFKIEKDEVIVTSDWNIYV
jgi:hypothetical protein